MDAVGQCIAGSEAASIKWFYWDDAHAGTGIRIWLYSNTKQSRAGRPRLCGLYREASLPACMAADHEGALWNTMVFTVKSTTLWQMVEDSVPSLNNLLV
jgi:hypothetical protein